MFETLTVPEPTEGSGEYKTAVKAFAEYLEPQKCVDHHVYVFSRESQKSGENNTEFYTRLQLLARKCEFANTHFEIKRQIIQGTSSVHLRRKAIEQNLNLEGLLKAARSMETADQQTSEIEKQQSHAVGCGNREVTIARRVPMVHQSLALATLNVSYVVEVIHAKELVLLKAKSV